MRRTLKVYFGRNGKEGKEEGWRKRYQWYIPRADNGIIYSYHHHHQCPHGYPLHMLLLSILLCIITSRSSAIPFPSILFSPILFFSLVSYPTSIYRTLSDYISLYSILNCCIILPAIITSNIFVCVREREREGVCVFIRTNKNRRCISSEVAREKRTFKRSSSFADILSTSSPFNNTF